MAQLVEYDLAKVGVAGSSPVSRSYFLPVESRVSGIMGILFCLHKKTLLKFFAKVFAFLYVTTRYIFQGFVGIFVNHISLPLLVRMGIESQQSLYAIPHDGRN